MNKSEIYFWIGEYIRRPLNVKHLNNTEKIIEESNKENLKKQLKKSNGGPAQTWTFIWN